MAPRTVLGSAPLAVEDAGRQEKVGRTERSEACWLLSRGVQGTVDALLTTTEISGLWSDCKHNAAVCGVGSARKPWATSQEPSARRCHVRLVLTSTFAYVPLVNQTV